MNTLVYIALAVILAACIRLLVIARTNQRNADGSLKPADKHMQNLNDWCERAPQAAALLGSFVMPVMALLIALVAAILAS